jgi:hypothetical protein
MNYSIFLYLPEIFIIHRIIQIKFVMNNTTKMDKEVYSSPTCSIINVVVEKALLQISTKDWEHDPDEL